MPFPSVGARAALLATLCMPAALAAQDEMPATIRQQGCLNCHDLSNFKAGPPFKTVAAKYRANREAGEKRIASALKDGVGHPRYALSPEQLQAIVDWVLSL
jgi:cytochrome c551/c552